MDKNSQSKIITLIVVSLLTIGVGIWLVKSNILAEQKVDSLVTLSENVIELGDISMAKGNAKTSYIIKNEGDDPVRLTQISTSCMCTTAVIDGEEFGMHEGSSALITIPPRSSKQVLVTFDPNAHGPSATGPVSRIVFMKTNSTVSPQLEFRFTANVIQ